MARALRIEYPSPFPPRHAVPPVGHGQAGGLTSTSGLNSGGGWNWKQRPKRSLPPACRNWNGRQRSCPRQEEREGRYEPPRSYPRSQAGPADATNPQSILRTMTTNMKICQFPSTDPTGLTTSVGHFWNDTSDARSCRRCKPARTVAAAPGCPRSRDRTGGALRIPPVGYDESSIHRPNDDDESENMPISED
jgi:hypothetical protein